APAGPRAARSPFMTLRGGLGELVESLASRLDRADVEMSLGRELSRIRELPGPTAEGPGRYRLELGGDELVADAVVLAISAPAASRLLRELRPRSADLLDTIPHASSATVSLAYPAGSVPPSSRGYGFVVPTVERGDLLAATFTSWKWAGRAPDSISLVRGYVGGVGHEALLAKDDEAIASRVQAELWRLAGVTGKPSVTRVHRFRGGMPQYTLGHLERVAAARADLPPGLFLAGASYGGVGIPDCIGAGYAAAGEVLAGLDEASPANARLGG
ncbi:MAG: protoporphyrinogen oxidase, partial [Acidimicrobiia bacterium]